MFPYTALSKYPLVKLMSYLLQLKGVYKGSHELLKTENSLEIVVIGLHTNKSLLIYIAMILSASAYFQRDKEADNAVYIVVLQL